MKDLQHMLELLFIYNENQRNEMLTNDVYILANPERGKGSSPPDVPPFPCPHLLGRRTRTDLSHLEVIPVDCEHTSRVSCTPQTPTFTFHGSDTVAPGDNAVFRNFKTRYRKLGL